MTTLDEIETAARAAPPEYDVLPDMPKRDTILALCADLRALADALHQHNEPWFKDAREKALQNLKKWGLA